MIVLFLNLSSVCTRATTRRFLRVIRSSFRLRSVGNGVTFTRDCVCAMKESSSNEGLEHSLSLYRDVFVVYLRFPHDRTSHPDVFVVYAFHTIVRHIRCACAHSHSGPKGVTKAPRGFVVGDEFLKSWEPTWIASCVRKGISSVAALCTSFRKSVANTSHNEV